MSGLPDHKDLICVLTELYTLLDTLAAVPRRDLKLPLDTGIHAATEFKAEAARSVSFSAEAVKVMSSNPYLEHGLYLQPHTHKIISRT